MEKISVVVSCYNEEESIPLFYNEIKKVMSIMKEFQFEVLFVDDGSKDRTLEVAKELAKKDECIKYVSFSRNFGKEAAMYAGLSYASGEYVTIMDADLQDPPSLLPEMMRYIKDEGYDSVATRRVTRKGEPKIRSFFARRFYHLIKKISDTEIVDGARDYRLMTRQFVNSLLELEEYNRFSKGLYGWVGYKTKWMEYENVERVAGETKWSFWKLFVYAIEGIVAFSTVPLLISAIMGIVFCVLAFILIIVSHRLLYIDITQKRKGLKQKNEKSTESTCAVTGVCDGVYYSWNECGGSWGDGFCCRRSRYTITGATADFR